MFERIKKFFNSNSEDNPLNQPKILVVDDSAVDRTFLSKILSKASYQVKLAENGLEGLGVAAKDSPDLIILDCEMPEMDGVEMCRRLKANPATQNIPVIFLTSDNTPRKIIECFEADAENHLTKPVNSRVLIDQIASILKNQSGLSGARE